MKNNFPSPRYKRTATPVSSRIRAVSCRHHRYVSAKSRDEKVHFIETEPSEKKVTEDVSVKSFPADEKAQIKDKKSSLWQRRKARLEDVAERILKEPQIPLRQYILNPASAMETMNTCQDIMLSRGTMLLLHLLKWAAFGIFAAAWAGHLVNRHAFSILSMSFTQEAYFAFLTGLFGFVTDYICLGITGLIGKFFDEDLSVLRIDALRTVYYIAQTIGMFLAAALIHAVPLPCFIIAILFVASGIMLRFYSYLLTCRFSKGRIMLIISINIVVSCLLYFCFSRLFLGEYDSLIRIVLGL